MTQFPSYNVSLADDTHLTLVGADEQAAALLALFSAAARFEPGIGSHQSVTVSTNEDSMLAETTDGTVYQFRLVQNEMAKPICFFGLSHVIAQKTRNGILLHGALAEYKNRGVLLIAQGGTGKTTASNRLQFPWRSLSDDLTMVVRDAGGGYWAHPWPTWSRFSEGGKGGVWDVQRGVPLHAIFHLSKAKRDGKESLGAGESVILLMQSSEQAFLFAKHAFDVEFTRRIRLRKFEQFCILTRSLPVARLYLSLTGSFWHGMEEILEKKQGEENG